MLQEFVEQLGKNTESAIREIHTAMPGKVIAFDSAKGTASVQPIMKFKKPDGEMIDYPQLTGVPVVFPQALSQQATLAYPVKEGDGCLIIVAEQSIDYWMYGQETNTDLAFDLTNAICIPGLFRQPSALVQEACRKNAIIIGVQETKLSVGQGYIEISAPEVRMSGNLTVSGNIDSGGNLSAVGAVSAGGSAEIGGSVSAGGGVSANGDVTAGSISLKNHTHRDGRNDATTIPL